MTPFEIPDPLPPLITRKVSARIGVIDAETGQRLHGVVAANTEECWLDECNTDGRHLVSKAPVRRYCDFDLFDVITGKVIMQVRRS